MCWIASKSSKLVGITMLMAMLLSVASSLDVIVFANANQQPESEAGVTRGPEHAVEVLVSRVELLIERIREFSEKYNITLNEDMNSMLSEAEAILDEVNQLKETNVTGALHKVLYAARLVMPVYVYVIQNLPPTVKDEFAVRRTEAEFQVRERTLLGLNITATWLSERDLNIPEWVFSNITRGLDLINEGRQTLQEGNVTGAKALLREVDDIIRRVMLSLKEDLRVKWVKAVCNEKVLRALIAQVNALVHIVNETVKSIDASDLESAVEHLNAASRKTDVVLSLVESLEPYITVDGDLATKILSLSKEIATRLKDAVEAAKIALDHNDPDSALLTLSTALDEVQPLLDELKSLVRWKAEELEHVKGLIVRVRDRIREKVGMMIATYVRALAWLNGRISQLEGSLIALKNLYMNERISCETYLTLLNAMKQFIEKLLSELPPSMHGMPRTRLNTLLTQVNTELSNTTC